MSALVRRETGAGRDETSHDDVLLEAAEGVRLAVDRGLGEHLGGLLEGRRRDERLRRERGLRDAEEERLGDAGLAAALDHALVLALEDVLLDLLVDEEVRVADVLDAHAAQHLTNDDLDVLVVDGDALQAVDLLDLVDEVRRELLLALDAKDVVRVRRPVLQRLARADAVARLDVDVLALRDQVLARLIGERAAVMAERRDDDLALALGVLAERNLAVDLRDDGVVLRLAGLEELGDARKTTGDVLGLRGLARDLRDDVARLEQVAVLDDDVRADREEVTRFERRCSGA